MITTKPVVTGNIRVTVYDCVRSTCEAHSLSAVEENIHLSPGTGEVDLGSALSGFTYALEAKLGA